MSWNLEHTLPGGHRLFTKREAPFTGKVYVADESGQTPDLTDDGLLWLDLSRPLLVQGVGASVPVLSFDAGNQWVGVGVADLLWLSDKYGWVIQTTGASRYRGVRVTA